MMSKTTKAGVENRCPFCDGENLSWGNADVDENSYYYEYTCHDCGADGREWYDLVFSENKATKGDNVDTGRFAWDIINWVEDHYNLTDKNWETLAETIKNKKEVEEQS